MRFRVELYDLMLLRTVVFVLDARTAEEAKEKALEQIKSANYSVRSVEEVDAE